MMKVNALLTALTVGFLSLQTVTAETQYPIDTWVEKQLEKNYSTAGMLDALYEGEQRWDKELNKVYSRLMKSLSPAQIKALKNAQRAWITFRDAEVKAINEIIASKQGSMYRVDAANLRYELIKQRTLQLQSYED